jgi:hypothetical protein
VISENALNMRIGALYEWRHPARAGGLINAECLSASLSRNARASMLAADDMVNLVRKSRVRQSKQTILAPIKGA